MTPAEVTTILRHLDGWPVQSHSCKKVRKAIDAAVEMIECLEAAEKERDALRTVLTGLLNDLEERAKWNLEESQRVVACGNGVYMRAKAALEESK